MSALANRLMSAFGWGALGSINAVLGTGVGLGLGARFYPQPYSQFPVAFFYIPAACIAGFVTAAIIRLARPRWSHSRMSLVMLALSLCCFVLLMKLSRDYAIR